MAKEEKRAYNSSQMSVRALLVLGILLSGAAAAEDFHWYTVDADISTSTLRTYRAMAVNPWTRDRREAMLFFSGEARKYADTATAEILRGLSDDDAAVRAQAAVAFGNLRYLPPGEVLRQLDSLWQRDQFAAAVASAYRGQASRKTAIQLLAGLSHPEPFSDDAYYAFKFAGSSVAAFVQSDLVRLIDSPNGDLSCYAMAVLADTRTAPPSLAPKMQAWIKQPHNCDWQAASVLGAIGPPAASAIPDLLKRIQGTPGECCSREADELASIGVASVPGLLAMAEETDPYRRAWAAYALGKLGDRDMRAGRRAIKALDDPIHEVQFRAMDGLERLGVRVKPLAPFLFKRMLGFLKVWYGPGRGYGQWPSPDIKMLIAAMPVPAEVLFKEIGPSSRDLEFRFSSPNRPFDRKANIVLDASLKNTGPSSIRLVRSNCSVTLGDPTELLIVMEPGWLLLRSQGSWTSGDRGLTEDDGTTMVLKPGQSERFGCMLQGKAPPLPRRPEKMTIGRMNVGIGGGDWWDFDYYVLGMGAGSQELRPGRYKIRGHYRLRSTDTSALRHWGPALEKKYGKLWNGDVYSNEIEVQIR